MDTDSKGFIWLGTSEGIYRFDGNTASKYKYLPSTLSEVTVSTILCTPNDELWCGTANNGIIKIDLSEDKFVQYTHNINDSTSLAANRIKIIFRDSRGYVWIGTHISGFNKFIADSNHFQRLLPSDIFPDNIARNINDFLSYQIDDVDPGLVWVSTLDGLIKLNTDNNELELFYPSKNKRWHKITAQPPQVMRHFVKIKNHVFAGTWGAGMVIIDLPQNDWQQVLIPATIQPNSKKINYRVFAYPYNNEQLLVSSTSNGLYNYNIKDGTFQYLGDTEIRGIMAYNDDYNYVNDVNNRILLNRTPGEHLQKVKTGFRPSALYYNPRKKEIYVSKFLENQMSVLDSNLEIRNQFAVDFQFNKKHYWVGSFKYENDKLLLNSNRSIYAWPDNQNKPTLFPYHGKNPFSIHDPILSFCQDSKARLWMGGKFEGLKVYNTSKGTLNRFVLNNGFSHDSWVSNIESDGQGNIWYGTERGFGVYIDNRDEFVAINIDSASALLEEFCSSEIIGIVRDKDHYMWVASSTGHLLKIKVINGKFKFKFYPKPIVNSTRYSHLIIDDEYVLWLKNSVELVRIDPNTLNFQPFSSDHGIIKPIYVWPYQQGKVIFGQQDGFYIFDPKKVKQSESPGELIYSEFYIFDQKKYSAYNIPIDDKIHLNYDENFFSITTSLIGVIKPSSNDLQYRLIGLDDKWVSSTTGNTVSWTNLGAGEYKLEVRQKLSSGQLIEGQGLEIIIAPPFWQTNWFRFLIISLIGLGIYLAYRARVNHLLNVKKHQLEVAGLEMKTLRSQMNPHFIFNCLNSIKLFVLEEEYSSASTYINKFSKLLRTILRNSKQHYISLKDELESLTHYIELEKMRFTNKFDYTIEIDPSISTERFLIPPLILQPFVENAIWHGLTPKKDSGLVKITFTPGNRAIICSIEDNGVGRQFHAGKQEKRTSFGISITQERLEVLNEIYGMNAKVEIKDLFENSQPSGTRVTLTLPHKEAKSEI